MQIQIDNQWVRMLEVQRKSCDEDHLSNILLNVIKQKKFSLWHIIFKDNWMLGLKQVLFWLLVQFLYETIILNGYLFNIWLK